MKEFQNFLGEHIFSSMGYLRASKNHRGTELGEVPRGSQTIGF